MPSKKLTSLKGQVAIVTGAGGGLGREYALLLAAYGAKVVVNDYGGSLSGDRGTVTRAQAVVNEITTAGGEAIANGSDISVKSEVDAMVAETVAKFGTVHILINNAGIAGSHSSHDNVNVAGFMRVQEIAILGTILCISAVYFIMEKQNYGRIVNTSSDSIYGMGAGGDTAYCSSKGAVFAMTRDLGMFAAKHSTNLKINGILPSAVSRMSDMSPVIKKLTRTYFATERVAHFVLLLAAEECPVSGELFSAGGGRAARTLIATVPGHVNGTCPESYLEHFDEVMGTADKLFVPNDTLDFVSYAIKNATGVDLGKIDLNDA